MRIIEKLLWKAKSRPQPDIVGFVMPWDKKWHFTLHKSKGRNRPHNEKFSYEGESKEFDFREDAIKYGESVMNGKGRLISIAFVGMDKKQAPFTPAEKEAAGLATD